MADQSDIENALVALTTSALYPNGAAAPSVSGLDYKVYRGWPNTSALNTDLSAGRINVTIFSAGEPGRNTTRYLHNRSRAVTEPTLIASISGVSVTFSGDAGPGQLAGILVDDGAYVYRTQSSDTSATVAANLAAQIAADWIVNLSGATVSIPGAARLAARTARDTSVSREIRRQQQRFRITFWCPTPPSRDVAASIVDQILTAYDFIDLPDGTLGRLVYAGTLIFDQSQDALLYRRDLLYDVDYSTIATEVRPTMMFGDIILNGASFLA